MSGISRTSVRRIAKGRLQLKVIKRGYVQKLTDLVKARRLTRCRYLLRTFQARDDINVIWFSDEKNFNINPPKHPQNDRLHIPNDVRKCEVPLDRLNRELRHYAPSLMVWAGVCANHKLPLIFLEQGMRLNARVYQDEILRVGIPQIRAITPNFTFMQVSC